MRRALPIAVGALLLGLGCPSRSGPPPARPLAAAATALLEDGGWYPPNRAALERWIAEVAARRDGRPRVAVFDWDETAISGDVGYATFRHQLDRLALRLTPEELAAFVPERVGEVERVADGRSIAELRADLLEAYGELWPLIEAGELDAARALPAHRDFRARAGWLYDALEAAEDIGPRWAYGWLAGWLAGHGEDEVRLLVGRAVEAARAEPPGHAEWTTASPGRSGHLSYPFRTGLCPQPEMRDLMAALARAGFEVFVVSASAEPIVEAAAEVLGYPVGRESIFGLRLERESGRLTSRLEPAGRYPLPYREGKVEVVRTRLPAAPLLVAGDSDGDYEMLTAFSETEIRLVVNRLQGGDIGSLYEAPDEPLDDGSRTLLQGRDERACRFLPSRETVALEPR